MSELVYKQEFEMDIFELKGEIDDNILLELKTSISKIRQQGSRKILCVGKEVTGISTRRLNALQTPVKVFCNMGGKIALAGFDEKFVDKIKTTQWYRYINVFKTEEEAMIFLNPHGKQESDIT